MMITILMNIRSHGKEDPTGRFFFQHQAGLVQVLKKKSGCGRVRVEVLNYQFGFFRVPYSFWGICGFARMWGIPEISKYPFIWVTHYQMIFKTEASWVLEKMSDSGRVLGILMVSSRF